MKKYALEYLIQEIEKTVTEPYSEWKIGIGNRKVMDDEGCISTIVLNPNNNPAVLSTYNYFKAQGMSVKEPVPSPTEYIYIFKDSWTKKPDLGF